MLLDYNCMQGQPLLLSPSPNKSLNSEIFRQFDKWLSKLKDLRGKARIKSGDTKSGDTGPNCKWC